MKAEGGNMRQTLPLILIVDDDVRNIFALKAVLKSRGYDCITAGSGEEGLQLLATRNEIGIVLLDMMMPDIGWIRNDCQDTHGSEKGNSYYLCDSPGNDG
jgi:CheY-like chemotaxis protein